LVAVEVWVAEVMPGDKKAEALDTKSLNGPADEVLTRVEELRNKGRIGELKRLEVTTVENHLAHAHLGQTKPLVIGLSVTATGRTSRNIMYRNFGADVRVTPRVGPENVVALELRVQDARPHVDLDAPVLGNDENKAPIRATETTLATVEGKVSVPSGQAVVLHGVKTTGKGGPLPTLVIVTARVLDGTQKEKKDEDAPPRPRPRPRRRAAEPRPPS
jgi:hypothetical protein